MLNPQDESRRIISLCERFVMVTCSTLARLYEIGTNMINPNNRKRKLNTTNIFSTVQAYHFLAPFPSSKREIETFKANPMTLIFSVTVSLFSGKCQTVPWKNTSTHPVTHIFSWSSLIFCWLNPLEAVDGHGRCPPCAPCWLTWRHPAPGRKISTIFNTQNGKAMVIGLNISNKVYVMFICSFFLR